MAPRPDVNDRFPIRESLSPPEISRPVFECAEAVFVSGFMAHSKVQIFANYNEVLADLEPPFGFETIPLNRPVYAGETLTAQQEVNGQRSGHSLQPVVVEPLDQDRIRNTKPVVIQPLYECGQVVPVDNLVPSTIVHVTEDGNAVGSIAAAQTYHPIVTAKLHAGTAVKAFAVACEGLDHEVRGPESDVVSPLGAPSPMPAPTVDAASLIPGNDVVTLTGLLVGAGIEIFDDGVLVCSGWYATAGANWFPVDRRLSQTPVSARQELCGTFSPPSPPEVPNAKLWAPELVGPICEGARHVVVRKSAINATVVILRDGNAMTHGGAAPGDLVLGLGQGSHLSAGDVITAVQYMDGNISPVSNAVTVASGLRQPKIEVLGTHPFFWPNRGEEAIPGGVFPRGRGKGPSFRIQACCTDDVAAWITGPNGQRVANLVLSQLYPGYFEAVWDWSSIDGWAVPGEIPVGEYRVHARSGCHESDGTASFFVIFDPAASGGPPRFSFDPVAVWFGTGINSVRGLHYYLRCSDWRVFRIAIQACAAHTDPFAAAIALARAEEALFTYSLNYHTNDVLDLVTNYAEAQCADDAACLTALLRAVGIPGHPVTGDAGLETGAGNWTFDTWVEFFADQGGVTDWWVLHPHEYPGMMPEPRSTFGTRGVAAKSFNDIIVMANENWVSAGLDDGTDDLTYIRNECGEPVMALNKAAWIDELCEAGYWAQAHWNCVGPRMHSLTAGNGFRLVEGELEYGGRIAGTVQLINRMEFRNFGRASVELVMHRLEDKAFGDKVFQTSEQRVDVEPDGIVEVPFTFDLPRTLAPGQTLYLRARFDERTSILQRVQIRPSLNADIDIPREWDDGEEGRAQLVIENIGPETARGLEIDFDVPYALNFAQQRRLHVDVLAPGERREFEVLLRAKAPLPSGSVHISISSQNLGALYLRRPFRVVGRPPRVEAVGGAQPKQG